MKAEKKKPVKEETAGIPGALDQVFAVQKPYSGCQLTSLVQPIDPLKGLEGSQIVPDQVHGVYPSKDLADKTANDLFLEYQKQQEALEKKKHMTMEKIKEVMDKIEEERAGHVKTIKENPENSQEARNKVAELATKMDELVNTMERIGKSKKNLDEKKGNQDILKKNSLSPELYQKAKGLKGFKESDWEFDKEKHQWNKKDKKEDIKEALKKALK